jgi:CheY-like chemotaxis protein
VKIEGTVGINCDQSQPAPAAEYDEADQLAARGRGPRRGRILIMDDDRIVRETMRRQLVIFGFEVVAAANGQEALGAYRQAREAGQPFDAVILDLMVNGGWGGEETLPHLLKVDPGVKALVCSGSLSKPVAEYHREGFCGVLGKPYAMGELRAVVEAAVPAAGRL